MRRVTYVSGTRADFGLMRSTLLMMDADPRFELSVVVTGMHLLSKYGNTVEEIQNSGLSIAGRLPVKLSGADGAQMAIALGQQVIKFTELWSQSRPDIILLLGDRGEMLAAALAALHLNIFIAHLHGGERSGTIDESIRHAISKIAHVHLTATLRSQNRLVQMGESPDAVYLVGAPGLDGLLDANSVSKDRLFKKYGLSPDRQTVLVLFHPVVQQSKDSGQQIAHILQALGRINGQVLFIAPNADAGGSAIRKVLLESSVQVISHLPRADFLAFLKHADVLAGNSSSGIIEAASFGIPVVNIGDRQRGRERNANVRDVPVDPWKIYQAVSEALNLGRVSCENIYGDGRAGQRIISVLAKVCLAPGRLEKCNVY